MDRGQPHQGPLRLLLFPVSAAGAAGDAVRALWHSRFNGGLSQGPRLPSSTHVRAWPLPAHAPLSPNPPYSRPASNSVILMLGYIAFLVVTRNFTEKPVVNADKVQAPCWRGPCRAGAAACCRGRCGPGAAACWRGPFRRGAAACCHGPFLGGAESWAGLRLAGHGCVKLRLITAPATGPGSPRQTATASAAPETYAPAHTSAPPRDAAPPSATPQPLAGGFAAW